nr:hypothetical protein [uncultured bacterium]
MMNGPRSCHRESHFWRFGSWRTKATLVALERGGAVIAERLLPKLVSKSNGAAKPAAAEKK